MPVRFAWSVATLLLTYAQVFTMELYLPQGRASSASGAPSRPAFTRVYPVDTPGLIPPVTTWKGRMGIASTLNEIGGTAQVEITIGTDGDVRDALVTKVSGGARVEALAVRAAGTSHFRPAVLDGRPVAVRLVLDFTMVDP